MTRTTRAATVAVYLVPAILMLATTGCSGTTSGSASPAAPSSTISTPSATGSNVFDAMSACQVLDQLLAGQGFDPGKKTSRRNECGASKYGWAIYAIALDSQQGLAEFALANTGATETTINQRRSMQAEPSPGMCVYALEVGKKARALAITTMILQADYSQACPNAKQLAENLEPLLPKVE